MKIFLYVIIAIVFLLVTFFGMGPVVLADGSMIERIITFIAILLIYLILGWFALLIKRHIK